MGRLLLTLLAVVFTTSAAHAETKRPNIVVIMADDMGISDIGCYGSEIATPNLDALASGGVRFTQFYNNARCCPTRASLLTGLYPHQAGVGHMMEDKGQPGYRGRLNDSCVTIAEVLQPAGYRTLMVGKWHVGGDEANWPASRGFTQSSSLIGGASSYFKVNGNYRADREKVTPDEGNPDFYITDHFSQAAVSFLQNNPEKEKPFFMYLAYTAPHWPLHARPENIAKYRGKYKAVGWDELRERRRRKMIELGVVSKETPLTPRDAKAPAWDSLSAERQDEFDLKMAVYAAQIESMDRGIGQVVAKLKEIGAYENTLILFLADNGGCAEEIKRLEAGPVGTEQSYVSYGLPWANASNTPFRTYKHWVHEGGIASPLIAHWPGRTKPNTLNTEPAHVIDLMPTCVELAGATYPRQKDGKLILPMEGYSLAPLIEGKPTKLHEVLYWEHEGNRAVRRGDWKLVAAHGQPWELYDLSKDRVEMNDLAKEKPELTSELAFLHDAWTRRAGVMDWARLNKLQRERQQKKTGTP